MIIEMIFDLFYLSFHSVNLLMRAKIIIAMILLHHHFYLSFQKRNFLSNCYAAKHHSNEIIKIHI